MKVLLARHGRAGDAPTDEERRLTEAGREGVIRVAKHVAGTGITGAAIHSSPLVRAMETAAILAQEMSAGEFRTEKALASGATIDQLIALLGEQAHEHARVSAVVFVGHMPDLGVLAAWLAWGTRTRVIELSPGAMVQFTVSSLRPEPKAVMDWLVTPQDV